MADSSINSSINSVKSAKSINSVETVKSIDAIKANNANDLNSSIDQKGFKSLLKRNILLPLGVGIASAVLFITLIFHLLSVWRWVEHSEQVISKINETAKLTVDMETGLYGFLITNEESFLWPYELSKSQIALQMDSLLEQVADNPLQVERIRRIQGIQAAWEKFAQQMIELRRTNQNYAEIIRSARGKMMFDRIRREFLDTLALEQSLLRERNIDAEQSAWWTVGAYLFFILSLSAILAFLGRRDLLNLSTTYANALQKHVEDVHALQQQAWVRTGKAQLNERMAGQMVLSVAGERALEFIAQYLDVPVAALYTRKEDGSLERIAAYGFERGKEQVHPSFYAKEGMVGQAAQEYRLLVLRDVPEDYLRVTSALGQGRLKNVAVLPFAYEGKVNGVLELGFMREVAQRDLDFLQLAANGLGASIGAALYRERLHEILAETQQMNEELQVQQEELRNANEELEEQSHILETSQATLENQKAELEQNNKQLAEQTLELDRKNVELNNAQSKLEERAQQLQLASRYKSEFLANMSHELRTPLNSSLILAKLLADNGAGNLNAEQIKFAQTIYSAGNDLLNLINDILDISKIEAGKLELKPEEISLSRMAAELQEIFEPQAQQKHLNFTLHIDEAAPAFIFSDRLRLEQILRNLLSNAIKFTDAGEIALTIQRAADGNVSFSVRDSGIGIESDKQQIIFEAFEQADGTTSRRYGGTGLGLSISRNLAYLLGGAIYVQSEAGQGSTFTLKLPERGELRQPDTAVGEHSLPLQSSPSQSSPSQSLPSHSSLMQPAMSPKAAASKSIAATHAASSLAASSSPKRALAPAFADDRYAIDPVDQRNPQPRSAQRTILVIEDEPEFAQILFELAHELQFNCLVAQDAEEGISLANQFLPNAILLDMRLPDRSGLAVLQQLKNSPATRHIPVHVVSAFEFDDAALHLGAIGYAVKPATREELKEVFFKLEQKFTQHTKRILLVEDDQRQRESVGQLIGGPDIEIVAVASGEEALQQLRSLAFDCIIIDLKLPDIQGNELLRRMASENIRSFPPVIVYTGRNLTQAEEAELLKYSRSIIIKGARSPERLLDEVTLFLHKVESQLSSEAQSMLKVVRSRDRIFEGRKVLLVDDDVRNIFALTSALEHKGLTVEIGRNGFDALQKLDEASDISIVLMDVMMPGMDGLEATRRIRKDPRFQKLPIIAITAKAMKDDQEQCMQAGATDYLAKPIDLERLYALLRVWMPHLERHAE